MTTVIMPSATAELWVEEFTGAPRNNSTELALGELGYYQGVALTCGVLNDITVTRITRIPTARNRPWYSKFRKSRF